MLRTLRILLFALLLCTAAASSSFAQDTPPRFGVGLQSLISTEDGLGIGVHGRVSVPVNNDFSVALGGGFTGFVLEGRDEATYVFDPQIAAIVTLPYGTEPLTYFMGGVGAYVPFNGDAGDGGPTLHAGVGRVWGLVDTSIYAEINPGLIIGESAVDLVIPLRFGVIF